MTRQTSERSLLVRVKFPLDKYFANIVSSILEPMDFNILARNKMLKDFGTFL
jgi:hypothetical protein